jgi:hypothetical protein
VNKNQVFLSRLKISKKKIWTSLDPIKSSLETDFVIKHMLAYLINTPIIKLSTWPHGVKSVTSFITTIDDDLFSYQHIFDIFENNNIPHTLFLDSDAYAGVRKMYKDSVSYEIGVTNHKNPEIVSLNLHENFNFFESEKLSLEEMGKRKVSGFLPYKGIINANQLNSLEQNHYSYFYGNSKIIASSPIFIMDGSFLYVPNTSPDSQMITANRTLISKEDVLN